MHEKVFSAASFGASSLAEAPPPPGRSETEGRPPTAPTERTVLMFLGGLLGGLMILSLGFLALVSYEGFNSDRVGRAGPASPD